MGSETAFQRAMGFDAAWARSESPDLESYLDGFDGEEREQLFRWLLEKEVKRRRAAGSAPVRAEYEARFPAYAPAIADVWQKLGPAARPGGPPSATPASRFPVAIPGHELLAVVGEGSQGIVYRSREIATGELVAVKVGTSGGRSRDRFRAEAEIAARLNHPGIVRVTGVGDSGGLPYMRMEFVPGLTLEAARQLAPGDGGIRWADRAARYVADVADAIQHAHEHRVVHRDLKPANVLVGNGGRIKVMDFGSARDDVLDRGLTATAGLIGTPAYMAPEQVEGRGVDPRTDVYGLGGILYYLLAGRPPFAGDTFAALREQILREPPAPPHGDDPQAAVLWSICQKCLQKNPGERYASAARLAEDLRAVLRSDLPPNLLLEPSAPGIPLAGELPVAARAPAAPPVTRRERAIATATAVAVVTVLVLLAGETILTATDWIRGPIDLGGDPPPRRELLLIQGACLTALAGLLFWYQPRVLNALWSVATRTAPTSASPTAAVGMARSLLVQWRSADRTWHGRLASGLLLSTHAAWSAPVVVLLIHSVTSLWETFPDGDWLVAVVVGTGIGLVLGAVAGFVVGLPTTAGSHWLRSHPLEWAFWSVGVLGIVPVVCGFLALCVRLGVGWGASRVGLQVLGPAQAWFLIGAYLGLCGAVFNRLTVPRPARAVLFRSVLRGSPSVAGAGRRRGPRQILHLLLGLAFGTVFFSILLVFFTYRRVLWVLTENGLDLRGGRATYAVLVVLGLLPFTFVMWAEDVVQAASRAAPETVEKNPDDPPPSRD